MTTAPEIDVIDAAIIETIKRNIGGFEVFPQTCARGAISKEEFPDYSAGVGALADHSF